MPDPAACAALCSGLRKQVAEALTHLVAEVVPLPASIVAPAQEALARLTPEVMEPALFVLYARLRDAAFADDMPAFDAARSLFAGWRFASVNTDPLPRLRVLAAGDDPLSYDHQAKVDLTKSALADDVGLTTALGAPPDDMVRQEAPKILSAARLLAAAAPDWAAETFALAREVVLATDSRTDAPARFAGGSVFDLFGAILVNPDNRGGVAGYLMTLVHESSHQRLFCYHLGDEIVLNDGAALYRSPLRQQLRPMEGIYHAAWVSARMAKAAEAVLAAPQSAGLLEVADREKLVRQIEKARHAFANALSVVREHGQLTALGQKIMDDAEAGLA